MNAKPHFLQLYSYCSHCSLCNCWESSNRRIRKYFRFRDNTCQFWQVFKRLHWPKNNCHHQNKVFQSTSRKVLVSLTKNKTPSLFPSRNFALYYSNLVNPLYYSGIMRRQIFPQCLLSFEYWRWDDCAEVVGLVASGSLTAQTGNGEKGFYWPKPLNPRYVPSHSNSEEALTLCVYLCASA